MLRTREFIMKDAYTFDRDREGLDVAYDKHAEAYARMLDRCGLEWYRVAADVGMMGGHGADEYMAPCAAGENDVALAPGYAANIEVASADAQPVRAAARRSARPSSSRRPGATTIEALVGSLGVPAGAHAQGLPGDRRRRRDEAGGRPRRPPRQRDQAPERPGPAVPRRPRRRDRAAHRARRATSARSAPSCRSCSTPR